MTINNEQIQALKAAAEKAIADDWGYDRDEFSEIASPEAILSLLAERDADKALIANLTAERDALREGAMGDARHSNTRAAADIYFQLAEECQIPPGGSLVQHIDMMRDRIAELEDRTVNVKLPDSIPCPTAPEIIWLQTNGDDSDESKWPESDDDVSWCREKIFTNDTLYVRADLAAAGITLVVEE